MELIEYKSGNDEVPRMIERYIQSGNLNFLIGSGASRPAINLAGNVEAQIDAELAAGNYHDADRIALEFIEELEDQNSFLPDKFTDGDDTCVTLRNYTDFLEVVDRMLFLRKNILLPRQCNLFTTNYDEFIESAAARLPSTVLNDGFNRRVGSDEFELSPEILFDRVYRSGAVFEHQSEVPTLNLIKLHGSLSWKRKAGDRILYGYHGCKELTGLQKGNPDEVSGALAKRAVILPNMRKFESTLLDRVYFDLLRLFSNAMDKENALLFVFGFSFADQHITDITARALRNPTAKVIIFSYDNASRIPFEKKFRAHRNATVIFPVEEEVLDFKGVNEILSHVGRELELEDA